MNGNAAEWVADCWNDSYESAPADGSAWLTGTCESHPVRGGGWAHFPEQLTSSYRLRLDAGYRTTYVGFRLAM
jgi:formylglycine-generating enzyme required for sulfatase activity